MLDVNDDAAPLALHESDDTEAAAGHVPGEYRQPDVNRLERSESPDHETDPERDDHLRDDRDV